jgi:hypothetical protein
MSDDGKKDDAPKNPIIDAATASIAGMFKDVIAAMSSDAVALIRKQASGQTPAIEKAVADLTEGMLAMLAARVGNTMPTVWPPASKSAPPPASAPPEDDKSGADNPGEGS